MTHYEVLGVPEAATRQEIRRAYRELARRHHPDRYAGTDAAGLERARRRMATLNRAWEVLGDPRRRRSYDVEIGLRPSPAPAPAAASRSADADDVEDLDDLHDLTFEDWVEEPNDQRRRISDLLMMIPALMVASALALLLFSDMMQSAGIRRLAVLLLPVAGVGFVIAPLFAMVRSRRR